MRRGEIWTASGESHYGGKPRPVLIIQDDLFDATASVTVCPLTSDPTEIPLLRIPVDTSTESGLSKSSCLMVDKVTTTPRTRLGERIGRISDTEMLSLERSLIVFLGLG